jgi:hypothetical protein
VRRLAPILFALVLVPTLLAGCDVDATPYAAQVHGTTIASSDLTGMMSTIESGNVSKCLFSGAALTGAGSGTYSQAFASSVLTFMIERSIAQVEVGRDGLSTTPLGVEAASQLLSLSLASAATTCAPGVSDVASALPAQFRGLLSEYETAQATIAAHLAGTTLTASSLETYAASHPLQTSVACVSVIVVSSETTAASLAAKARSGTSFAALARANSEDTTSAAKGGALGCNVPIDFPDAYSGAISALATGAISPPFSIGSPYYAILTVTSRTPGTALDAALGAITVGSAGLSTLTNQLASSGVDVDPTYGSWSRGSDGSYTVVSPAGPANKDVANLAALTPPTPAAAS